jgi:hypothetical protein
MDTVSGNAAVRRRHVDKFNCLLFQLPPSPLAVAMRQGPRVGECLAVFLAEHLNL